MLEDNGDVFDPVRLCTRGHTMAWLWREAQVYASTPEDLIDLIAPGHEIHLDPGVYNLTEWFNSALESLVPDADSDYELVLPGSPDERPPRHFCCLFHSNTPLQSLVVVHL